MVGVGARELPGKSVVGTWMYRCCWTQVGEAVPPVNGTCAHTLMSPNREGMCTFPSRLGTSLVLCLALCVCAASVPSSGPAGRVLTLWVCCLTNGQTSRPTTFCLEVARACESLCLSSFLACSYVPQPSVQCAVC